MICVMRLKKWKSFGKAEEFSIVIYDYQLLKSLEMPHAGEVEIGGSGGGIPVLFDGTRPGDLGLVTSCPNLFREVP